MPKKKEQKNNARACNSNNSPFLWFYFFCKLPFTGKLVSRKKTGRPFALLSSLKRCLTFCKAFFVLFSELALGI